MEPPSRPLREALPGSDPQGGRGSGDGQSAAPQERSRVRELIEGRGAEVLFLPPYSPDFNPIEEAFSRK